MYNMTCVYNCFTVKVPVSNFKVEKSEKLGQRFLRFTFFDMTIPKKRKKSCFWISKKRKNVFSNYEIPTESPLTGALNTR